ncbi:TIR domain-containing protein [Escherichia coli]|nr:TIR domain-containing protein [Escherichia coli]
MKEWISEQMEGRICTVILAGTNTADRKWINHEIVESWNRGMGVVAIHIHGLKNKDGEQSAKGKNPLSYITHGPTGKNYQISQNVMTLHIQLVQMFIITSLKILTLGSKKQ